VFTCGGEVAGGHGRRSQVTATAGAVAPASRRLGGGQQAKEKVTGSPRGGRGNT
jgi:hypothetical protein